MVKSIVQPVILIVAHLAVSRIRQRFVIFRIVVLNLVTADAIRFCIEYTALMAIRALNNCRMTAGKCKSGGGMVKGRGFPGGRGMTGFAKGWDAGSHVAGDL